jgi:nucleotide-binding universal stress UspA family protein
VDASDDAKRAARRVLDLLQPNTITKIVAFHSVEHPTAFALNIHLTVGISYGMPSTDPKKIKEEYKKIGKKILDDTKDMFAKANKLIETRLIEDETPEEYIVRIVEEEDFDLLALGSKGEHSRLKKIFMGSIAQKVLNDASCDVLVVR